MKRVRIQILGFLIGGGVLFALPFVSVYASRVSDANSRSYSATSPRDILDTVVKEANQNFQIQDNKLNGVNGKESSIGQNGNFKITGTLDWLRRNIQPYLQWLVFISLTGAVILLIWNGFKLVMGSSNLVAGGDIKTVKENIKNIITGIIVLTSFSMIIIVINALINYFLSQ